MLLFFSCNNSKKPENLAYILNQNTIENGVLVCRLGNGYFSEYFRKYASKEKRFSHIGIISKENDTLYVYHSEASELTGIGHIKREKLNSFLKDINVYEFFEFNYSDLTKNKILNEIRIYHSKKTPFDLNFNSFNDNELYCSELIASSINRALKTAVISPTLVLNGKKIYALDDIYLNKNVIKITLANYDFK